MKYDSVTGYNRPICPPSYLMAVILPSKMTFVKKLFRDWARFFSFAERSRRQSAAPGPFEASPARCKASVAREAVWIRIWTIMPRATRLTANQ